MKKQYRHFEEDFKRNLIARIDSGGLTKSQAAREHNLANSVIDRWQRQIHDGSMRVHPTDERQSKLPVPLPQIKMLPYLS